MTVIVSESPDEMRRLRDDAHRFRVLADLAQFLPIRVVPGDHERGIVAHVPLRLPPAGKKTEYTTLAEYADYFRVRYSEAP